MVIFFVFISVDTVKSEIDLFFAEDSISGGEILKIITENAKAIVEGKEMAETVDSDVVLEIKRLLDEHAKPFVQADGGDIEYVDFIDGVVQLRMVGACASCPSSTVTAKFMIRNMLHHYVPEVIEVESIEVPEFDPDNNTWTG